MKNSTPRRQTSKAATTEFLIKIPYRKKIFNDLMKTLTFARQKHL